MRGWGHVWFRCSLAVEVKERLSQDHITPVIYHGPPTQARSFRFVPLCTWAFQNSAEGGENPKSRLQK